MRMFGHSLSFKLVAGIVLVEVVMLSVLIWDNASTLRHSLLHRLEENAGNVIQQYAVTAAGLLKEENFGQLSDLSSRVSTRFDIAYLTVLDSFGQEVLTFGDRELAKYSRADGQHDDIMDDVLDLEEEMPIDGEIVGTARIGFSLRSLNQTVDQAVFRGVAVETVIVILTIIVGGIVGHRITANLRKLATAALDYGAGKTVIELPDEQSDEVGIAARAFRKMIKDRKEAAVAVADGERRLRDIADNIEDVVWINSPDFSETRYVNPAFEKIFGLTLADLQRDPMSWANAMVPEEAEKLSSTIEDVTKKMAAGEFSQDGRFEYPIYKVEGPDGITRDIYARSVAMKDAAGNIERFVGVATDVTKLLNAQEEVRLSNERLLQAQKMESIGQLTGGVAHDFNNLLAVVLGNLELIEDASNPKDVQGYLDAAKSATYRGADLTKSLLSFARQSRLEPDIIDINQIVSETKDWSSRVIPENIDVEIMLHEGLWRAEADPSLTQNALLNLILNARDAMPQGGKMTIITSNVNMDGEYNELSGKDIEPGRYVMLTISDTGEGIPQENIAHIFDPFFTTKPVGKGSGLGLSMVQGFLKQSGGTVRVYSEKGVGTTFKLFFRAASGKPEEPAQEEKSNSSPKKVGAQVFVVEDDAAVLEVLSETLKKAGYQITSARSGDEALSIWDNNSNFDILVTDIVMPGDLQGTQLARALRERNPNLPVVFMSGYTGGNTVHGNGLRPEDTRLMKPVRRIDLIAAVETALKKVQ